MKDYVAQNVSSVVMRNSGLNHLLSHIASSSRSVILFSPSVWLASAIYGNSVLSGPQEPTMTPTLHLHPKSILLSFLKLTFPSCLTSLVPHADSCLSPGQGDAMLGLN